MQMIQVYQAATVLDAEMAGVKLRKLGVNPYIEGDSAGSRGPATPITVWVREADVEKARTALAPGGTTKRTTKTTRSRAATVKRKRPS